MDKRLYIIKFLIFLLITGISLKVPIFVANIVSSAEDTSVTAIVGEQFTIIPTDSGGRGLTTSVVFSGYAYPGAIVQVLKDRILTGTTTADSKGYFSITLNEIYSPSALYTLYSIDKDGKRSLLLNYPIVIKRGYITQVSGIRFSPTISLDKTEVKVKNDITVTGFAIPYQLLKVNISGPKNIVLYVNANDDGRYKLTIPLIDFNKGVYNIYTNYNLDERISKVLTFVIGEVNILSTELVKNIPGDCNADQVINLVDFSIAAFWYGKANPPKCVDTNNDKIINLVDFSIFAFYWTG